MLVLPISQSSIVFVSLIHDGIFLPSWFIFKIFIYDGIFFAVSLFSKFRGLEDYSTPSSALHIREFAARICRANLPCKFAATICSGYLPREYAAGICRLFAPRICRGYLPWDFCICKQILSCICNQILFL